MEKLPKFNPNPVRGRSTLRVLAASNGASKIFGILLLLGIVFSLSTTVYAAAPNPGHNFTAVSGGVVTGDLLYGSATDTLSALADVATGSVLISGGVGVAPSWSASPTLIGNLTVSKADPTITLTDTGDSNSVVLTRSDTTALATMKNTVSKVSDSFATSHDGNDDVVQLPSLAWATVLGGNNGNATIAGWFYQNSPGGANQVIFGFSSTNFIFVRTGSTNQLNAVWGNGSGTTIVNTATSIFSLNTWVHVAFVKTGSTALEIFVNGVSRGTSAGGGTVSGTTNAIIGGITTTTQEMNGKIDEVAVWDRALTSGEISDLYASGSGLYLIPTNTFASSGTLISTNLQGLWHLDDGTGTTATDTSVNVRNGTLLQQTAWVDGKVVASVVDEAALVWSSQDGTENLERGIQTYGDGLGRTVIDGKTIRFNIASVEQMQLDASGNLILTGNQIIDTASLVSTNGLWFDGNNTGYATKLTGIRGVVASTNNYLDFNSDLGVTIQAGRVGGNQRVIFPTGSTRHYDNIVSYFGTSEDAGIRYATSQTPDSWQFGVSADSRLLMIAELADLGTFDFAHALQANPTLFIHSATQSTTEWIGLTHDASDGVISTGAGDLLLSPNSGLVGIGTAAPNKQLHVKTASGNAEIDLQSASSPYWGIYQDDTTDDLRFWNVDNRLTLTAAGNVGIGTVIPSGILSVTPTQYSTGTASQSLTTVTGVGTTFTSAMVGSQLVYANGVSAGTITAFTDTTHLTVSTSQTVTSQAYNIAYTGLQVGSTGNVGIGTASPSSPLDVRSSSNNIIRAVWTGSSTDVSNLVLQQTNAADGAISNLVALDNGGQFVGAIGFLSDSVASDTGSLIFRVNNALSEKMRITTAGNVGIGTTSPKTPLQIGSSGTSWTTSNIPVALAIGGQSAIGWDGPGSGVGTRAIYGYNQNLYFSRSADTDIDATANAVTHDMVITSGGNVGIGTASPVTKLDVFGAPLTTGIITGAAKGIAAVVGDVWTANDVVSLDFRPSEFAGAPALTGLPVGRIGLNLTGGGSYFQLGTSNNYSLGVTNTGLVIDPSGNVGIGDTTPDFGLDVVADINSDDCFRESGVQIAGTCASDIRLKKNIHPLNDSLNKIMQLKPVEFEWKEGIDKLGGTIRYVEGRQVGLIAQDVENVLPHLVEEKDGYLSVEYNLELQMMLINAVQELKAENNKLKKRIEALESK